MIYYHQNYSPGTTTPDPPLDAIHHFASHQQRNIEIERNHRNMNATLKTLVTAIAIAAAATLAPFAPAQDSAPEKTTATNSGLVLPKELPPALSKAPAPSKAPALKFEKTEINFGTRDEGDVIDLVYPVENTSDRVVAIKNIHTGCGCTQAANNPQSIKPGEKTAINLTFNSLGKRGETNRIVSISTDDPAMPEYRIVFTGSVVAAIYPSSPQVDFGDIDQGKSATRQFSLFYTKSEPFEITSVKCADPRIKVELLQRKPFEKGPLKGDEFVFRAEVPDNLPPSEYYPAFIFETNQPQLQLPFVGLKARVVGDIVYSPSRVFVTAARNEETSSTITLRSRSDKTFTIQNIQISPPGLPFAVKPQPAANSLQQSLEVDVQKIDKAQTYRGQIQVTVLLDGATEPSQVQIPAVVIVRANQPTASNAKRPAMQYLQAKP